MSKKEYVPGVQWVMMLEKLKKAKLRHEELAYMIPAANELVMDAAKRLHRAITGCEERPHVLYHRHQLADAKWYHEQVNQLWRDSHPNLNRPILRMPMVVLKKKKPSKAARKVERQILRETGIVTQAHESRQEG